MNANPVRSMVLSEFLLASFASFAVRSVFDWHKPSIAAPESRCRADPGTQHEGNARHAAPEVIRSFVTFVIFCCCPEEIEQKITKDTKKFES